ncbi:hypothetical protein CDAR_368621 [Caerostris darwini]|uniref:Uncharacterized protein n=1 Tax=Caerostris darwini TaxID=1538125 RepID=A0AAV4WZA3_9ARAC|nr:hypothetical protein CDAR_368621 [Caerostris darwini]
MLRKNGKLYNKISDLVGRPRSTVQSIIKKFAATGKVQNISRTGRPCLLTSSNRRFLVRSLKKDPKISAPTLTSELKNMGTAVSMSFEVLMAAVRWGAFQCKPDCTEKCSWQTCLAQRRAVRQYELVVRRLLSVEKSLRELQEENKVLRGAQKNWLSEQTKLKKLIPDEISNGLPGPSRSPMSPAKKRRAHSPEREVSRKRQRVDSPSASLYQRAPAPAPSATRSPTPSATPSPTPSASPSPTPSDAPAARRFHFYIPSKHSSCVTQASQLKPAPARRPGRPRDLTLSREVFEEVVEELHQEQGAVLSNHVPLHSSLLMEEYLNCLWATARLVTKRDRRAAAAILVTAGPRTTPHLAHLNCHTSLVGQKEINTKNY